MCIVQGNVDTTGTERRLPDDGWAEEEREGT